MERLNSFLFDGVGAGRHRIEGLGGDDGVEQVGENTLLQENKDGGLSSLKCEEQLILSADKLTHHNCRVT